MLSLSLRSSRGHSVTVVISGLHLAPILFDPYRNLLVPIVADIKFELYSRISPNGIISQFSISIFSVINLFTTFQFVSSWRSDIPIWVQNLNRNVTLLSMCHLLKYKWGTD